ncbi:MAG: hypothetical protein ACLP5H_13830 [Desulfomonilaceae bacterium]
MNKRNIDPANVQIRPMKVEDVGAIAVIDSMYFGAPRPEYYREKLGSATKGAGIITSLVAEARTTILQAECKG